MSGTSEMRQYLRGLEKDGWTVEKTGGGHFKLTPPGSDRCVFTSSSPGDHRTIQNTKSQCKRLLRSLDGFAITASNSQH